MYTKKYTIGPCVLPHIILKNLVWLTLPWIQALYFKNKQFDCHRTKTFDFVIELPLNNHVFLS